MISLTAPPTTPCAASRLRRAGAARVSVMLRRFARCALPICCMALAGCKSPLDKRVDINDVYGPAGRHALNVVEQAKHEASGNAAVGLDEFNAALKLYEEQKY